MKFLPGNPGGPGRPKRSTEEKYLRKLTATVPLQEWREIILTAVDQAKNGDASARRWLSEYLVGRPLPLREEVRPQEPVNIVVSWCNSDGDQDYKPNIKVVDSIEVLGKGDED